MAISLSKGQNISLTKTAPGLSQVQIGLGWKERSTDGAEFDLDAVLFAVTAEGKVRSDADFVFFNQKLWEAGIIEHMGDNRSGIGDGDDEVIEASLAKISADIAKLIVAVTIHEADSRHQNFGMVGDAFIRITDKTTGLEIARYDLSEDASVETAMVFGEIYRNAGEWKFRAVGQGFQGGLAALGRNFGVQL